MFIAVTRFSLFIPNSTAWLISSQKKDATQIAQIEEYKRKLFDSKRLDFRISFLEKVTLPLLDEASKGYKFVHIIEYSDSLPSVYIDKLKELQDRFSFLQLNEYNIEGISSKKAQDIAIDYFGLKKVNDRDVMVGMFNLDDDDCISVDYFKRCNKYLNKYYHGHSLSLGLGVAGVFDESYELSNIVEMYYPKVNIGLLRIGVYRHQAQKMVFASLGAHMKADRYAPTIIDSREVAFFWSKHKAQDTAEYDFHKGHLDKLSSMEHIDLTVLQEKFGDKFIENLKSL